MVMKMITNEEEQILKSFIDVLTETDELKDRNPNGVVHKWDEVISVGGRKAIITHMNKYNGVWFAMIISGDTIGKIEVIMHNEKRNWKRTGRSFEILGDLFDTLGNTNAK